MWRGDYLYLFQHLIAKDFRIRYRNMSLGVLWSVVNPLVMMAVLTFVFTVIMPSQVPAFAVFVICGLVPFNFFANSLMNGTTSLVDNASLIKRVPVPREVIPVTSVLANSPHLLIQMALVLAIALWFGRLPNVYWLWLPVLWVLEIVFVCGLVLLTSILNAYVRDMRYIVESATVLLWWLVPIIYPFSVIPQQFAPIYEFNPIAALVLAMRTIIIDGAAPSYILLGKFACVSGVSLGVGLLGFGQLKRRLYARL